MCTLEDHALAVAVAIAARELAERIATLVEHAITAGLNIDKLTVHADGTKPPA